MSKQYHGIVPILVTPFGDDDLIDFGAVHAQVRFLVEAGVAGLGLGFGSEMHRLGDTERDQLTRCVQHALGGEAPLVVQASGASARSAAAAAAAAAEAGADAVMVPVPAAPGAPDDHLVEFYAAVAGIGVDVLVQDAPTVTGVSAGPRLLARIAAEVPRVAAIKVESSPSTAVIHQLAGTVGCALLGGQGGLDFLGELRRGSAGTMPGPATPTQFRAVWEAHAAGRADDAARGYARLLPLLVLGARSLDVFITVQKEILRRRGLITTARLRRPHASPDPVLVSELDQLLTDGLGCVLRA